MTALDVLTRFLADLAVTVRGLRAETSGVIRKGPTAPLVLEDLSGGLRRSGVIPGLGTWALHGMGCRFELDTGEDVDFDWNADGIPTFDVWRLRKYASSIGAPGLADADLLAACRELSLKGVIREEPEGWFVVPE
jgi:hypothetical protein